MKKKMRCWEFLECTQKECPAYQSDKLECWLIPGTRCRSQVQGEFLEKMDLCLECEHFTENLDEATMRETLKVANEQVAEFRRMVEARDKELEEISMELAIGLSEVFEALKVIYSGDPSVRIPEASELELISKLKHMVNLTAENLGEIVDLSHEFAIGLAEHFDVLHRVSKGDLAARVFGTSKLELLEALKNLTNKTIESVAEEISERKRAEIALVASQAELMESEEKYRSLFDSGPDPIFVLDRETLEILDANASAEETYCYSRQELIGHSFVELGLFEDEETGLSFFSTDSDEDSYLMYSRVRHYKKGRVPFYVSVHFCLTRYKETEAIIVSVTDITEMIEKDAQLIQASKMTTLGEMSAGMAHELNQPLNAIKMGNEYLKMMIEKGKTVSQKDLYQVVNEVSDQVDRAAKIIDRLREFGRKADFTREKVDINKSIRDVLAIIGRQLSLQNIEVKLDLDQTIPPILAHKNRLEQVIFNMVTNARDAIGQKKESVDKTSERVITIRSYQHDGRVAVTVSDTGIGIPRLVKERIFEPFFTTKEVGKGMGLGLSITYGIVRDYGGEIGVESEEGKGSTFRITFPQIAA
ncbi:MAG: PAS domain S-box protein [Deltaproteobacteria bacterium]|nr:MAG: PAS domain S-box protein [Deltaproteobacteria bacterium]